MLRFFLDWHSSGNMSPIYLQGGNVSREYINNSQIFSDRLKSLRGSRSKAGFAKELGINSPVTYFNYENGRVPNSGILEMIASKCNVTVDWLLGRDAPVVEVASRRLPEGTRQDAASTKSAEPLNFVIAKYAETEMLEKMHAACVAAKDWQAAGVIAVELAKRTNKKAL